MSDISDLYDNVMAEHREKTASQQQTAEDTTDNDGSVFDAEFFDKVASNDADAVAEFNEAVEAARAGGASDEDIEASIDAMISEAYGQKTASDDDEYVEDVEGGDFEEIKVAAYNAGAEQALIDVLESELAKVAGVTLDDLADFDLGGDYAAGYAQTREHYAEAVEKIAEHKQAEIDKAAGMARNAMNRLGFGLAAGAGKASDAAGKASGAAGRFFSGGDKKEVAKGILDRAAKKRGVGKGQQAVHSMADRKAALESAGKTVRRRKYLRRGGAAVLGTGGLMAAGRATKGD